MIRTIKRINDFIGSIEYLILVPMFAFMLCLMIVQVVCRYFLSMPLGWSEELVRYVFISSIFIGGALATKERQHIEINFLVTIKEHIAKTPKQEENFIKISNFIRDSLTVVFMTLISKEVLSLLIHQKNFNMVTPAIQLPFWIITGAMFVGSVMVVVHSIFHIILNLNGEGITGYEKAEEAGGDL